MLHILRRRGRHASDDDCPVDYDFFILASTPKHGKILEDDLTSVYFLMFCSQSYNSIYPVHYVRLYSIVDTFV